MRAGQFREPAPSSSMYTEMYKNPAYLAALSEWGEITVSDHYSKAELACRWITFNFHLSAELGDGSLGGASNIGQHKQTLDNLKGPLALEVAAKGAAEGDAVWEKLEAVAPSDNIHL
ncbi:hypothetical protein CC78DRAFT_621682 [Lojkania enalia]|uniref:Uncharacterized protein n=1 Tax=Lojkania enalia TaxID=147567 RepID=A0A9P4JY11_9PLEO|nr:hypothetical protein CC78DRAFT_621682 [Didymosphaeria enalia]